MGKIEWFIYTAYVYTPIVFLIIAILLCIVAAIRKIRKKTAGKFVVAALVCITSGIFIFLIIPAMALIFGFGPGLSD